MRYLSNMSPHDHPARPIPVRRYALGSQPGDDLSAETTIDERLAMVDVLSRRMWELTGQPWPSLSRAEWPIRIIRRS